MKQGRLWHSRRRVERQNLCRASAPALGHLVERLEPRTLLAGSLLADINLINGGSNPEQLTQVGDSLFFTAMDARGRELWKTDGTPGGTVFVKDITPGSNGSVFPHLTDVNGILYFTTLDSAGMELWRSDGTGAGTFRVKDISPGGGSSSPRQLTVVGDTLFFTASTPEAGLELWKSDGTEAGTTLVKDIRPGPAYADPTELVGFNGALYFVVASYPLPGATIWRSDGTDAGTVPVGQNWPQVPQWLTPADDALYFVHDRRLWKSDGTSAGARPLTAAGAPRIESPIIPVGDAIYFEGYDQAHGQELWMVDGASGDTVRLTDINPGPYNSTWELIRAGDSVYFTAFVNLNDGTALYKADRTTVTPLLNENGVRADNPFNLMEAAGSLFFQRYDPRGEIALWTTDGTRAGTRPVKDVFPGPQSGHATPGALNGQLLFVADDPVLGKELWRAQAPGAALQLVADIEKGAPQSSHPQAGVTVGDTVFFTAVGALSGRELYKSDGTPQGTSLVSDILPGSAGSEPTNFHIVQGKLVFTATDPSGVGLWVTDGASAGTRRLAGVANSPTSVLAGDFRLHNNFLYFSSVGPTVRELWRTDGTPEGTTRAADVPQVGSGLRLLGTLGDHLYFQVFDGAGFELWRTDAAAGATGAVRVKGGINPASEFTVSGGIGYFATRDISGRRELWRTDGAEAGTWRVADIAPGPSFPDRSHLFDAGGTLYFFSGGNQLWRTDGTTAGTIKLADVPPKPLVSVNGVVFFSGHRSGEGQELWKSDGTPAGTGPVKDIWPGAPGSGPDFLTPYKGLLYFIAGDGAAPGRHLWRTDGTPEGTRMVARVSVGPRVLSPRDLTVIGDYLYFIGTDAEGRTGVWRSDGTPEGAIRLADDPAQPPVTAARFIGHNNHYLLVAQSTGPHGMEPHVIPLPSNATRPSVLAARFDDQTAPPRIVVYFSKGVAASVSSGDLVIIDRATHQPVAVPATVAYDPQTDIATWTLNGPLPDGNFRATLRADSVTDGGGAALTGDFAFDFFRLAGDVNGDRAVDFADLAILAQNYNRPSGMTRAQGDFTGDGAVNIDDLALLAQKYNTRLAAPASAALVFSTTPIPTAAGRLVPRPRLRPMSKNR